MKYILPFVFLFVFQISVAQIYERVKQPPTPKEMEHFIANDLAQLENHKQKDWVKELALGRFVQSQKEFPKEIRNFSNLETLGITGFVKFQNLSQELTYLKNLKNLYLDNLDFSIISKDVSRIKNLEKLRIGTYTDLSQPVESGNLKSLKHLTISRLKNPNGENPNLQNVILPVEIGKLENLEELHVFYFLKKLPSGITGLPKLQVLNLRKNNLNSLPTEIAQLQNLKFLLLEENDFRTFPKEVYKLKNLENIYLDQNNLTAIPPGIASMQNLKQLSIARNKVSDQEFKNVLELKNLEVLAAGNNQISDLQGIEKLQNLKNLYLDDNLLESNDLAPIYNLSNLETLFLRNNRITHFPKGIEKLKKLRELLVKGNPVSAEELMRIRKLLPDTKIIVDY